jgi:Sec7-like guanine-nucleotide exchange factor
MKNDIADCVRKFNYKVKAGLKMMIDTGLVLPDDPASLVIFLQKQHANLDKEKLGDFLSGPEPFNNTCLQLFTNGLSFKGLNIDEAMRYYLA